MHSDYSHDGKDSLEVLRETCVARGIRFIGMTDHAEDLVPEEFEEYRQQCAELSGADVRLIPGLEFRFAGHHGLHLLALDLREWITPTTPAEFFEQTRSTARMTVLAHPTLAHYRIPQVVLDHIDAIEVWNGNYNTRYLPDPRSMRLVSELRRGRPNMVATVGLDQHDSRNDRELRVVLPGEADDPIAELKAGRFINVGRTMRLDSHASLSPARLGTLSVVRGVYDVIERVQDRATRFMLRIGVERQR
ncbi:MAG TPA: PHP domain-containing protein [Gemmatimonadaceae bacterium]